MSQPQADELQPYLTQLLQLLERRDHFQDELNKVQSQQRALQNRDPRELNSLWFYVLGYVALVAIEILVPVTTFFITALVTVTLVFALAMTLRTRVFHASQLLTAFFALLGMWITPFLFSQQVPFAGILYPVGLLLATITLRMVERSLTLRDFDSEQPKPGTSSPASERLSAKIAELSERIDRLDYQIGTQYRGNLPRKYLNHKVVSALLEIVTTQHPENLQTTIKMYEAARKTSSR